MAVALPTVTGEGAACDTVVTGVDGVIRLRMAPADEWHIAGVVEYTGTGSTQVTQDTTMHGHFRAWRWTGDNYDCVDDMQPGKVTGAHPTQPGGFARSAWRARLVVLQRH